VAVTCWVHRFRQVSLKPASREKWQAVFLKTKSYWDWVQPVLFCAIEKKKSGKRNDGISVQLLLELSHTSIL
jgi:hypothetical protein